MNVSLNEGNSTVEVGLHVGRLDSAGGLLSGAGVPNFHAEILKVGGHSDLEVLVVGAALVLVLA